MKVFKNGAPAGEAPGLDLREGTTGGITLTVADEPANGVTSVTFDTGGSQTYLAPLRSANEVPVRSVSADVTQAIAPTGLAASTIPTGYAGNDIVEPSILFDEAAPFLADASGRNGYEYVLCAAPYPSSNVVFENPCLWVSHDATTWVPIVFTAGVGVATPGYGGTVTPLVANAAQGDGNNSDPFLVRGPTGTYYIFWNQELVATGSGGTGTGGNDWSIKGISAPSLAGPWTSPVTIIATVKASVRPSSHSMFWDGTKWHMYTVDEANISATKITHYTNTNDSPLAGTWVKLSDPTIAVPAAYSSQVWWHLNAYRWGAQHYLIVQDSLAGASSAGNLWLLSSADGGLTWTVPPGPMMISAKLYRAAAIFSNRGSDIGLDLYYGLLLTNWTIWRTFASFSPVRNYGGVDTNGTPINSLAVGLAKTPIAPYVFGDTANRADSAVTPGTADSGQAYTVSAGTAGISSKQLYAAVVPCRCATTIVGVANGVYTAEFSVLDIASNAWLIARYVDSSNYIRFGYQNNNTYVLQNIVSGSVSQTVSGTNFGSPGAAAGDIVAIVCNGSTVTVYINGVRTLQATGWTSNSSGTGIGFQAGSITSRFRNLTARPLVNGG